MEVRDEHIPEETFAECLDRLPQACVEIVVESGDAVLLGRRTSDPAGGEWFWPGSRLYKGERLPAAAMRVGREELGIDVAVVDRLGVYSHFWDSTSVEGLDSRHTVNVVFRVRPTDDRFAVELDEQHDDYRWVDGIEPWMHEHVREYLEDAAFFRTPSGD